MMPLRSSRSRLTVSVTIIKSDGRLLRSKAVDLSAASYEQASVSRQNRTESPNVWCFVCRIAASENGCTIVALKAVQAIIAFCTV